MCFCTSARAGASARRQLEVALVRLDRRVVLVALAMGVAEQQEGLGRVGRLVAAELERLLELRDGVVAPPGVVVARGRA